MNISYLNNKRALIFVVGACFMAAILRNAWACDDAYIIFRTIEQFFAGNGLRWNMLERVQTFTSPLWFWILCLPRLFSSNVYLNVIAVAVIFQLLMMVLLYRAIKNAWLWVFAIFLLSLSNAFMDFTTAGLEYPLIYCLCIVFFDAYLTFCNNQDFPTFRRIFIVGGMILITRHDLLLTILLPMIHVFWMGHKLYNKKDIVKSFLFLLSPLAIWTLFSLIYYGVPLPNTAYAKLGAHIPHLQLLEQGIVYFIHGAQVDPISIVIMLLAIILGVISKRTSLRVMAFTLLLVDIYIVWVGGDFMGGRFYAHLVLIAVFMLAILYQDQSDTVLKQFGKFPVLISVPLLLLYAVFFNHTPLNTANIHHHDTIDHDISDERGYWSYTSSIWVYLDPKTPYFPLAGFAEEARHFDEDGKQSVHMYLGIGFVGYKAPLSAYVSDIVSLADMFRARLPRMSGEWYIGHIIRYYPAGYPYSIFEPERPNWTPNPSLNEFWRVTRVLTRDEKLFSFERLWTIIKFNLGQYDYLVDHFTQFDYENKADIDNPYNLGCKHTWQHSDFLKKW